MSTLRERRAGFATPTHQAGPGLSVERRADAVTWDHLTAFTPGPVHAGDSSAGLVGRAWRARATPTAVLLSRAADDGAGWETEATLFTYTGAPVTEVDLAWDQNARAVVCAERATGPGAAPEVWLYWFDPQQSAFVFTSLGAGRSPRIVLDAPRDPSGSDLLLFFCDDAAGCVAVRQQRDRYAVAAATPLAPVAGVALERAVATRDGRVRVVASARDAATGTYSLRQMESTLYPVTTEVDGVRVSSSVRAGVLATQIHWFAPPGEANRAGIAEVGSLRVSSTVASATLQEAFVVLTRSGGPDELDASSSVISGTLVAMWQVLSHDAEPAGEALTASSSVPSGTLVQMFAWLLVSLSPEDSLKASSTLVSGTLTQV